MNTRTHPATITVAALVMALTCSAVQAQNRHGSQGSSDHRGGNFSQGHHHSNQGGYGGHGGYWRGGPLWGGVGLGIGLGLGTYYLTRPWYPEPVIIYQPSTVFSDAPPILQAPAVTAAPTAPEPIFYPRTGQSAAMIEADRQACNRWAATQANAMAEASVFQRAILACMDGRGYTSR